MLLHMLFFTGGHLVMRSKRCAVQNQGITLTQLTKKSAIPCCQSALSAVVQAWSALLVSPLWAYSYSVSWQPLSLFSLWTIHLCPSLPPFIFPLMNECDRCLLPLEWGLMGGRCRFTSHGDVTQSRGCWRLAKNGSPWTSRGTQLQ